MIKKMEKKRYDNVLRLILFQKEFSLNYLKKRQSVLTLILSAIKRIKKLLILQWIIRIILNEKNKKEVLDPAEDFVGTLGGGS